MREPGISRCLLKEVPKNILESGDDKNQKR